MKHFDALCSKEFTKNNLTNAQNHDPTLAHCRQSASDSAANAKIPGFYYHQNVLMRIGLLN